MQQEIITERLKLRKAATHEQTKTNIVNQVICDRCFEKESNPVDNKQNTVEKLISEIDNTFELFGIYDKSECYCGYLELNKRNNKYELGIELYTEYRGNGIGTESVKAICGYLNNEYNLTEIWLRIREVNTASINMFEKLGAEYIKTIPLVDGIETLIPENMIREFMVRLYIMKIPLSR